MAFKLAFLIMCALLAYQVVALSLSRKERDTDDAANTLDNIIDGFKTGFNDLVAKVQTNDLFRNFTDQMQNLGQEIAAGSKKLAEDTQRTFSSKK